MDRSSIEYYNASQKIFFHPQCTFLREMCTYRESLYKSWDIFLCSALCVPISDSHLWSVLSLWSSWEGNGWNRMWRSVSARIVRKNIVVGPFISLQHRTQHFPKNSDTIKVFLYLNSVQYNTLVATLFLLCQISSSGLLIRLWYIPQGSLIPCHGENYFLFVFVPFVH